MSVDRKWIRVGIVIFWAMWFTVVFATNLCDGLKALGILQADWAFASGNYGFMLKVTARYHVSQAVTATLFAGVILWEAIACALFWRTAYLSRRRSSQTGQSIMAAFAVGLALWAAFALADEILMAYDVEAAHMRLFIAQLVSLLFMELVPDN